MKYNGRWLIVYTVVLIALIQGVYGLDVVVNSNSHGESGSVALNYNLKEDSILQGQVTIQGDAIAPTTAISGPVPQFQQTHAVKDGTGKSASVSVNVVNASNGLTYESDVQPGEGTVDTQPYVTAQQWITVPNADSIEANSSASFGSWSADAGLKESKGSTAGDYVTLTGYFGRAFASDAEIAAEQIATNGSGNAINIFNHARNGIELFSVDTNLNGIAGDKAKFQGLTSTSYAGGVSEANQKEHLQGSFTSNATNAPVTGVATSKTRTSNFGKEFDLDIHATDAGLPTGILGYYINTSMATLNLGAIQGAVNASQSGDTINAAAGTYKENVQVAKSLKISGAGAGNTIVDGQQSGSAFTIGKNNPSVNVALSGMTIQNGSGNLVEYTGYSEHWGGGILNYGTVDLKDSIISGNTAGFGGGIFNEGTVTLNNGSITGNKATNGGGIYNYNGIVNLNSGSITGNNATNGGGIANDFGTVNMNKGSITGNKATYGAGIYNSQGNVTMNNGSITGNTASKYGGGILNEGTVVMNNGSITGNKATYGAGIFNDAHSIVTMNNGSITGNNATYGAGIFNNNGTVTMNNGSIDGNTADYGAGIYSFKGAVTMNKGSITGNSAKEFGAGIENDFGTVTMNNGSVTGNNATYGGGIFNFNGTVTMNNGSVTGNNANNYGGGILNEGTVTMNNGSITGNNATYGGGIFNDANGIVTMNNGSITENTADLGAGIYSYKGNVTMNNGSIARNTANYGGGIFNNNGVVKLNNGSIDHNKANQNGGGIINLGTLSGNTSIVHDNIPN